MKALFKSAFILLCSVFLTTNLVLSQAKDFTSQEARFVNLYAKLFSFIQVNSDSVSHYSNQFANQFSGFIKNNPNTLNYAFKALVDSNFCFIKTSGDGNFRIYSWDTWTGGSMHIFREIYQWEADGKVFTEIPEHEELDPGSFCSRIYTVIIGGKPIYLAINNAIFSNKDAHQSVSAFNIKGRKLVDTVKIFKTKSSLLNSIDVDYDFFSVVDRPERPLELITYDYKQKIIYIPVVDQQGQVTTKNILYKLKGRYFEYIGIQ